MSGAVLLAGGLLLLACSKGQDSGSVPVGPQLAHDMPDGVIVEGDSLTLSVTAEDPDGVAEVVVYQRTTGSEYWDAEELSLGEDGTWSVTLDALAAPGLEYSFRALDGGDPPAAGVLPADGSFSLGVGVVAAGLPYSEGFEPEDGQSDLDDLGWWSPSLLASGRNFFLSSAQAWTGSHSAAHLRGTTSQGELDDWLVSPALDLSTVDSAMVRWGERGAGTAAAQHSLWVSVGQRDPSLGDFVEVGAIAAPPEQDWGRAAVDLSDFVGEPAAYLAWRTVGTAADDWWIDDVAVDVLSPELVDARLSWEPDPVAPGETVAVTVTVDNAIDLAASDVTATLSASDGGAEITDPTVSVGNIAGLASASATWSVDIDESWPEHSYLPLTATFTDSSRSWDFPLDMVVGLPSTATVSLTTDQAGTVAIDLGVGHPDAPDFSFAAQDDWLEAGSHLVEVDLTPYPQWLPALVDNRWFARVVSSSDGQIDGFIIRYAGLETAASFLPDLDAGLPGTAYVPSPAAPAVTVVSPDSVSPGATGVALSLTVNNLGAETVGAVTATLSSVDDDAVITGGGPLTVSEGAWSYYDSKTLTGPVLDVAEGHLDSSPLQLQLSFDDGVDSWVVPVEVAVPWPVPRLVGVQVDDSPDDGADTGSVSVSGDGDGLLDGGETVVLGLTLGNAGDADSGALTGVLTVDADSAVSAELDGAVKLDALAAGTTAVVELELSAGEGSAGEVLAMTLALSDGSSTWSLPVEVVLGEASWISLSATDDAGDDALDGYAFDLVNARWRIVSEPDSEDGEEQRFELELESGVAFDPDTVLDEVFIEIWGKPESGSYSYYRWIVQPGGSSLEGYISGSGFGHIGSLDAAATSDSTVLLTFDLADLDLLTDAFSIGLAAGWCGPDSYYCDHLPDGWGYPYDSFSSGSWLPVEW